jgi:hypothetical protein
MAERSFPPKPRPSLARADVVAYLADLAEQGWNVYQDGDRFVVQVDDMTELTLSGRDTGVFSVSTHIAPGISSSGSVATLAQFEQMMDRFFKTRSPQLKAARLESKEPLSNVQRIVKMIGTSKIEGVFDPYLDDTGLALLLSALRMSESAAPTLRLITGRSGVKSLGPQFVAMFFEELGCANGRIRLTSNPDAHDRLLLLSSDKSIHVGPSWNNMSKSGQISLHSDAHENRAFFETEWAAGSPITSTEPFVALAKKLSGT